MFRNSHATVGQSQGRVVLSARTVSTAGNRRSFRLPPSAFRLGLSLTEVLISMGILTMGLLGVASVFPVASFYMQKGDVADRGSAIAQGAFNEVVTNGTLNPENWLVWADGTGVTGSTTIGTNNTYTRPFAEMLRRHKDALLGGTNAFIQNQVAREFGAVFVIDPMGVANTSLYDPTSGNQTPRAAAWPGGVYPCTSPELSWIPNNRWNPWYEATTPYVGLRWPVRRVTLSGVSKTRDQSAFFSRKFSTSDDLSMELPAGQSKPASQLWDLSPMDLNSSGSNRDDLLTRQARGDYSWIVTVSPTTSDARDALAVDPSGYSYEVSVVVFYKRPLANTGPSDVDMVEDNRVQMQLNERVVRARVVSRGLNGGELLLEKYLPYTNDPPESPFTNLKTGNWVMVCGPHPASTDERPMMVSRWYQVLAIEGKSERLNANGDVSPAPPAGEPERRLVSLRGPEWPWDPAVNGAGNPDLSANHLSNSLYVCIPTGAVAVHSKTIRLGGDSMWAGGAGGLGKAAPIGTAPPTGNVGF